MYIIYFCCISVLNYHCFVSLTGMLIAGILLNNVPTVKIIGENIDNGWSKALR